MKKTLRTILAGALALLTVSCYDDTAVNEAINQLGDRVTAIENTLEAEVGGIADLLARIELLEGKVAAIKVETDANGVTTLTLSNDSKIVLSKNGVLTIVDGGWATVAPDGTVTPLGVKVSHDHKLDFKVEGGELKVSYDGKTYESTGVKISDYTAHVIGEVVPSADGKSVTVTIGDQSLTLPLATEGEVQLSRAEAYVGYGMTKTVKVTGAEDFYVASKPDGWKVDVEGKVLTITAPSKALVELGAGHTSGKIVVHADADKCTYASMEVTTGEAFSVTMDKVTGDVTFFNAVIFEGVDHMGDTYMDFADAQVAILTADDYEYFMTEGGGILPNFDYMRYTFLSSLKTNNELGGQFEEGKYEEDTFTITLETLGKSFWPALAIEEGVTYYVCVVPQTPEGVLEDLYTYAFFKPAKTIIEAVEITHNKAKMTADLSGSEKYIVGCITDPEALYGPGITLEMAASETYPFNYMFYGYADELYAIPEGTYVGEDALDMAELLGEPLKPGTKYYYFAIPHTTGAVYTDWATQFAPYIKSFTTAVPEAGEVAAPVITPELSYKSVTANVVPAEGTSVYYAFVTSEELLELESDQAKYDFLMQNCYMPITEEREVYTSAASGSTVILLYATISDDAKYAVSELSLTTLSYPSVKNEALTVGLSEAVISYSDITVTITPAEGTKVLYKFYSESTLNYYATEQKLLENVIGGTNAADSPVAKAQYLSAGSKQILVTLILDAQNQYNIVKTEYTTKPLVYSESVVVTPVSIVVNADDTVTAKVKVEGAEKAALYLGYSGGVKNFEFNAFTQEPDSGVVFVDVDAEGYATATLPDYWGTYMVVYATGCKMDAEGKVAAISQTAGQYKISDYVTE